MLILYPEFNRDNAIKLANILGVDASEIYIRIFPNGEVLARLSEIDRIKNDDVIVYFPTYPDTNNRLIMLFQTIEAIKYYRANTITLVMPYLSYSRQDKRFLEGESLSLRLLLDILSTFGVDRLVTINPHNEEAVRINARNIDVIILDVFTPLVNKVLANVRYDGNLILAAPDYGRCDTVKNLADEFGLDYICLKKLRDRITGEVLLQKDVDINLAGASVVIVDDEISTGGTVAKAAKLLKNDGAKSIYAAAIHLLLVGDAADKLYSAGIEAIFGTNTIENPYILVDIEPILAEVFR